MTYTDAQGREWKRADNIWTTSATGIVWRVVLEKGSWYWFRCQGSVYPNKWRGGFDSAEKAMEAAEMPKGVAA